MATTDHSAIKNERAMAAMFLCLVLLVLALLRWDDTEWNALLWLAVLIAMCVIRTPHSIRNRANVDLPAWASSLGALAQAPFLGLFWRGHADLGRDWSPGLEMREDHGRVTSGGRSRVRPPMYAAVRLSVLAQLLLIHNWIAGALAVPAVAAMWFLRVPREEAMMRTRFGKDWDACCARAGRLFPKSAT